MLYDPFNYEREAQDFIDLGCRWITVGDGDREMRRWQFDKIYEHARRIQPGIVLIPVQASRRALA